MTPKVKQPTPPKMPQSPIEQKPVALSDDTSKFTSLISTSPVGLTKSADTKKKSLLGGA